MINDDQECRYQLLGFVSLLIDYLQRCIEPETSHFVAGSLLRSSRKLLYKRRSGEGIGLRDGAWQVHVVCNVQSLAQDRLHVSLSLFFLHFSAVTAAL